MNDLLTFTIIGNALHGAEWWVHVRCVELLVGNVTDPEADGIVIVGLN